MSVSNTVQYNHPIEIGLLTSGPDGTLIDITKRGVNSRIGFNIYDTYRLIADIEDSGNTTNIAEVAYNSIYGYWVYFHLRGDKQAPNYINTVIGVLMEQIEDISIIELEYRLIARNENENDYNHQLNKMLNTLIDFQRKRTSNVGESNHSSHSNNSNSSSNNHNGNPSNQGVTQK